MPEPSPSLAANPDAGQWLALRPDGTVSVHSGKVELGQGVLTALAQIVADELDVDITRVRMVPARTGVSPNEGYTAGSLSMQHSGTALRAVSARLRAAALTAAAARLGTTPDQLTVKDGEIQAPNGESTTYWALDPLSLPATAQPVTAHTVVGRDVPRVDIPGKVFGTRRYVHDLRFPGQLFGRVLRPPSRGARLVDVDESAVRALPGVITVVRSGDFLGVIAEREDIAVNAVALLEKAADWSEHPSLPDENALAEYLTSAPSDENILHDSGNEPGPTTLHARFSRPYLAHASVAPSCAVARWQDDTLDVWSHAQGPYPLRAELARWFDLPPDAVRVEHVEGAGCYGHNGADDVAGDAALLARAVPGRHVQVVWSRQDELGWAPFGPAMVVDVAVSLDPEGAIRHWRTDVWSNGHSSRPSSAGNPPLLAALHEGRPVVPSSDPPLAVGAGSARNAVPGYDLSGLTVVSHVLREMPLRTSALRSLGAHLNVYAIESVVDELADTDPIEYRLRMLADPRARGVLARVAAASDWGTREAGPDSGRGVGYARYKNTGAYCAVVADVEASSSVRVTGLTIAVDAGEIINPDGVRNQIEGGAIQSVGWTTKEQVRFDRHDVTSRTWEDYPILTFTEVPPVRVELVAQPGSPPLGAGEASIGPTAAAIGNAVRAALGVPVRTLPLTPENVIASFR
jgi:CO/xanthine dehydrogenase Mo-binding subunit